MMVTNAALPRSTLIVLAVLVLASGLAAGYFVGQRQNGAAPTAATPSTTASDVAYWYDPMVPDQHFDKPGKSPFMDMQLVPRRTSAATDAGVQITPGMRANLGIRTALVEIGPGPAATTTASGSFEWDLRGETRVSSRVDGFVEHVYVRAPFEHVHAGQPLASIVAPKLAGALAEYRALASSESVDARSVTTAARARLRVLGLGDGDVLRGDGSTPHVVLRAPSDGVLSEIIVRAGDNITPGQVLFRVNATNPIWLEARVPQAGTAAALPGTQVTVRVSAYPGENFPGRVDSLLPQIDPQTRTQSLRIVVDNPDSRLAAGMFAEVRLSAASATPHPWVASEALILTGSDARVIVERSGGFVPVRVRTGQSVSGRTEILEGLIGGERVVVSGQFLLDSEASLSGALERLGPGDAQHKQPAHETSGSHP